MSPPTFAEHMQKVKVFAVFAALLLAGCDGASLTYRNETPQPVVFSFSTPAGGVYQIRVPADIDPAAIIAANTQLGNALIQDVSAQRYQAQAQARRDWLGVVHTALICVAAVCFGWGAVIFGIREWKKGGKP